MRVRIPGVNKVRAKLADGTLQVYYYHRATKTRLTGDPGSPDFLTSLAAAKEKPRQRTAGTIAGLLRDFQASAEWRALADSTRREYKRMLTVIEAEYGDLPMAGCEEKAFRRDVLAWRDRHAIKSPREADHRVTAFARVLTWAVDRGHLDKNELAGFRRVYHSDRADRIWLPDDIARFTGMASPSLSMALMLALHTGQRQGDLLRLSWTGYDGTAISLRQRKTGARVTIPCTQALRSALDALPRKATVILTTDTSRPWTAFYFRRRWREAAAKAGIVDLHFHDLRGTAVTMLAEAGCTVPEIASITGHSMHSVTHILEKYLSRTRPLADSAIAKLEAKMRTNPAKKLQNDIKNHIKKYV